MKAKNKYYEIAEFKSLDIFTEAIALIASVLLFMLKDGNLSYFLILPFVQMLSAVLWLLHSVKNVEQLKTATIIRVGLLCYYTFVGLIVFIIAFYPAIIIISPPLFLGLFAILAIGFVFFLGRYLNLVIDEMNFYAAFSKNLE